MELTQEIADKFESASTLLEKVKVMLEDARQSEIIYNKMDGEVELVDDIALIQAFHGIDVSRIKATITALEFNLQMTRKPSTWVFVECQRKKSDAVFGWLANYGVKYKFVKMTSDNDGIFLKTPLWNIGASMCSESRLCFLDSDVVMCDSDWIEKVEKEFNVHDVLSLASHQYYEDDEKCELKKTIGYKWATENRVDGSHCGFTLGLTRDAFNQFNGFDASLILDDIQFYHRLCGNRVFKSFDKWIIDSVPGYGLPLRLGYADNVACHVWHSGNKNKYEGITNLLRYVGIKSYSEIIDYVDKGNPNSLPKWKDDAISQTIKNTLIKYNEFMGVLENQDKTFDFIDEYKDEMVKMLGEPYDDKHPLFACTVVKNGFGTKIHDIVRFRDEIEDKFKIRPIVLVFSDVKVESDKLDELNIVDLKNYDYENEFKQCLRNDLKWPKNAIAYYIPFGLTEFNTKIWIPEKILKNEDGTVLINIDEVKHDKSRTN